MILSPASLSIALFLSSLVHQAVARPFLDKIGGTSWVFGNEIWNATQQQNNVKQVWFTDRELVGNASGHYYSSVYEGTKFEITSAIVALEGEHNGQEFLDFFFDCEAGEEHWVIFSGQQGAYQYFIHKELPAIGEFRSLWRLDNATFTHGRTPAKDDILPPLSWHTNETYLFDSTFARPDGTFVTKYDFSDFIRNLDFYGVYGPHVGSWYINPGKDYYNGDHYRQELTVHREAVTGHAVQLNMINGNHFQRALNVTISERKMWGPWVWFLNNGSQSDAARQAEKEFASWPYAWLEDEAYRSRGSLRGELVLSDGRPASNAAVWLGDNGSTIDSIRQAQGYYYQTYADKKGHFLIDNIRTGTYDIRAWSNGSSIADVSTTFSRSDVQIKRGRATNLGTLRWDVSKKDKIFRIGDFDRTTYGFGVGGAPRAYGLTDLCPADLIYEVGVSKTSDWCYAQTKEGKWAISFQIHQAQRASEATLIVSLAGYTTNASSSIWANGHRIGNITAEVGQMKNDGSLYRSCTVAGDWRYLEFPFNASILRASREDHDNEIVFQLYENLGAESELHTPQRGAMFDAIALEW